MDRMKLRSELYLNTKTEKCVGLVLDSSSNKISLANEVQKLLAGNEKEDKEISRDSEFSYSLHVNKFRLRLIHDDTCAGELFFDNGYV